MQLDSSLLRQTCRPAEFKNSLQNLRTAQHLVQLMFKERGIGLAANQAGLNLRLFVMFVEGEIFHCFNPEIVEASAETASMAEGCLSFPGERCEIARSASIKTKFYNARGDLHERDFEGIAARCFQHELDHLNGMVMHDRIGEVINAQT